MIGRNIRRPLLEALKDTPVVLLQGARQTGKSTLVRDVATSDHRSRYLTMDDPAVLAAARHDAAGFVSGLGGNVVLDEVQRAPELFLAIKAAVDADRRSGRFLLTGSANVLLLPRLAESLAGRMDLVTLWPLSQGEIEGTREGFVDALFSTRRLDVQPAACTRGEVLERALAGGFPEARTRAARRRDAWYSAYIATIVQRDVRDLAAIEGLVELPRLLSLLAARATATLNFAEMSRSLAIPQTTLKRYLALLEATFLVLRVPPWLRNVGKRLVTSPKLMVVDSGLMASLIGLSVERVQNDSVLSGPLLENFVVMELRKQMSWSRLALSLLHFRSHTQEEVDIVLEDRSGRIVGLEVKASSTLSRHDLKGLQALEALAGDSFHRGVVLYTGSEPVAFGPRLYALPIASLWAAFKG